MLEQLTECSEGAVFRRNVRRGTRFAKATSHVGPLAAHFTVRLP